MKRLNSSDSLCALISTQSPKEEKGRKKTQIYSREFHAMLDGLDQDEGGEAEVGEAAGDKKRRLSSDQVKALEKNFEVENKLDPERKAKLAEELGLQPRQVAIWFQNRRARYKTKQLERDYGLLKAEYDSLKLDFDSLEHENEALAAELTELKMKLHHENRDSSTKEESPASESVTDVVVINGINKEFDILGDAIKEDPTKYEDGKLLSSSSSSSFQHNSSPLLNWIQFSNSRAVPGKPNLTQIVAADEQQSFGTTEDSCNFLSVDHAPTLHWYIPQ